MSAGIADVISASFQQFESAPHAHDIIGNKFTFDGAGHTDGFEAMITNMNKQESFYKHPVAQKSTDLLLMGDILEDAKIACDSRHRNVLRVGFYNDALDKMNEAKLANFQKVFDIVVCGDGSLTPVIKILHYLIREEKPTFSEHCELSELLNSI